MRKDVAKKWVKALRSGKYKQGQGYLKQFNSKGQPRHCCLGVLCEIYNDTMKNSHKKSLNTIEYHKIICFGKETQVLPLIVKKWAGMKTYIGIMNNSNKVEYCLSGINDSGKKFSTIANIIEENVDNL
jgi:hypothetical protein